MTDTTTLDSAPQGAAEKPRRSSALSTMRLAELQGLAASMVEGHPDNASASVYGGMTLSFGDEQADTAAGLPCTTTVQVPLHPDIVPVVFVPGETLSTAKARSVLPSHVRLADAAYNSARAALLVHAARHAPEHLLAATQELSLIHI